MPASILYVLGLFSTLVSTLSRFIMAIVSAFVDALFSAISTKFTLCTFLQANTLRPTRWIRIIVQSSQRSFDEYQLLELERRLRKERLKANLAVLDKYILYYQNSKLRQNNSALQASQESLSHSLLTNMRSNSSLFDTVSSQTSHLRDLSRLISENDLALHALLSENKTQAVALSQAQSRIADLAAENMRAKSLIKTLQKEVDRTRHNSDHSSAGTFKRYSRS